MQFPVRVKTNTDLIFEFDKVPNWMQLSALDQMHRFGFEYGHHGANHQDGNPYFGKLLFLKQENYETAKPHFVNNLVDILRYDLLSEVDKEGNFIELSRIAVNGQVKGQQAAKHIDSSNDSNLWTAIYYVNDSDGDTVFYRSLKNIDKEVYRCKYKRGKILLFHGQFVHQAMAPTTDWRVTVGISFLWNTKLNQKVEIDI